MQNRIRPLLLGALLLLTGPAVAQVPSTMAPNTVICRLGISAGPPQACPISAIFGSSNVQPKTANLTALLALGSVGFPTRTGTDTWAQRTVTGTANEITVMNGTGVSGNPTISLPSSITLTGKAITGGTYSSGAFNGTIGATTPSTVAGTTGAFSGAVSVTNTFTTSGANNGVAVQSRSGTLRTYTWYDPDGTGLQLDSTGASGTVLKINATTGLPTWNGLAGIGSGCPTINNSGTLTGVTPCSGGTGLPVSGTLGQTLLKYDSTNAHANWYTPGEFNISADPSAKCDGTNAANVNDTVLTNAFTNNNTVLVPPDCTFKISSDHTIAKKQTLVVPNGGVVSIDNAATLTVHGRVKAGPYKIFTVTGSGKAVGIAEVMPEWWDAKNDGATDDIIALNAAWTSVAASSASDGSPTIVLSPGSGYLIGSQWKVAPSFSIPLRIKGGGTTKTRIVLSGASITAKIDNGSGSAGTTLTVSAISAGTLTASQAVTGSGVTAATTISSIGTCGGASPSLPCTATVNNSQNISSEAMKTAFGGTAGLQIDGQTADGTTEVSDLDIGGFGITTQNGTVTGVNGRCLSFGTVNKQIQGLHNSKVDDMLFDGCATGLYIANTRLITFSNFQCDLPQINGSTCILFDQLDTTNFTADMEFRDFQLVPNATATGQRDIYFRTSSGTTGLAGIKMENGQLYPPTGSGGTHLHIYCDAANVSDIFMDRMQYEGSGGPASGVLVQSNSTGQCYDVHITNSYFQGLTGIGVELSAASSDKVYDIIVTENFMRGLTKESLAATNTNNVVFSNNVLTSAPGGAARFITLNSTFGTMISGNTANTQGGSAVTYFVEGNGSAANTGCVNNRAKGAVTTFSNGMTGSDNDCTGTAGGGTLANRP